MSTVFFDIDTQLDFLLPAGALPVPGGAARLDALTRLNHYAGAQGIPLVSSMDAHTENDPEFRDWPPHCVLGTLGQQKPAALLLTRQAVVDSAPGALALDGAPQLLVQKQTLDLFQNAKMPALLEALRARRCVVYGVVTEVCVGLAVRGLLARGHEVEVVADAVQGLTDAAGEAALRSFQDAGARLTTVAGVLGK